MNAPCQKICTALAGFVTASPSGLPVTPPWHGDDSLQALARRPGGRTESRYDLPLFRFCTEAGRR
jgi:hypothetical protein